MQLNPPTTKRYLFVSRSCPYCRQYLGVLQRINARLPHDKRISYVDTTEHDNWNVNFSDIIDKINFEDTPYLYVDGWAVIGSLTPTYMESLLNGRLSDEYL